MKQQRLVVAHQKLIERHIEIRHERGHTTHVRRDLRNGRQGNQKRDGRLRQAPMCQREEPAGDHLRTAARGRGENGSLYLSRLIEGLGAKWLDIT